MKHTATIAAAAALMAISTGAFAQGNMNAPTPNSTGTGVIVPGTTSTGRATDVPQAIIGQPDRSPGTTGSATGNYRRSRANNMEDSSR
jgi:hypothetical protein